MMGTKKAAGLTATRTIEQQTASYPNHASKSIAKLDQIANLLLELATANLAEAQRVSGWLLFEQKLNVFYGGRKL